MPHWRTAAKWAAAGLVAVLLLIQLVPYGRDHDNPSVVAEPSWDFTRTRELAAENCFDCHSNETHWPWYSNIAPMSWYTYSHVMDGRNAVNYSEWNRPQEEGSESAETVREGEMPPWYYKIRPDKGMSEQEHQELIDGLIATFGSEDVGHEDGEDDD